MEKLIELLNKAQNSWEWLFWQWTGNFKRKHYAKNHWRLIIDTDEDYEVYDYSDRDICGKDVGFIKWLVDNDKIDHKKANLFYTYYFDETWDNRDYYKAYTEYESLLMLLSIQDNPIEFLISILK